MSEKTEEKREVYRKQLPETRVATTHKFSVEGQEGYVTVGFYEDGKPGELFITMAKEGSTLAGTMDAFATAISLLLQCGVPLEFLVNKFSHVRFEPSGWTNNPQIPFAKSVIDYVFRWLASKFLPAEQQVAIGVMPLPTNKPLMLAQAPGQPGKKVIGPPIDEDEATPAVETPEQAKVREEFERHLAG